MKKKRIVLMLLVFLFFLNLGIEAEISKEINNNIEKSLYIVSYASAEKVFPENLEETLKNEEYDISFLTEAELSVTSFRSTGTIKVIGTNENFQYLSHKKLRSGVWFNALQAERENKVAVLSEGAALQYFGSTNIASNELEIDGLRYMVAGVTKDDGVNIYIPNGNMAAYHNQNNGYSQLWCNLQNEASLSLFLQKAGIKDSEVTIFRGEEYLRIVNLRINLIFWMIGILLIVLLLKNMKNNIMQLILEIKKNFEKNYAVRMAEFIKEKKTVQRISSLLLCIGALTGICGIIRFELILPGAGILDAEEPFITGTGKIMEFYIQPHIWVESFYFLNKWNLLSVAVLFLMLLLGSIIICITWSAKKNNQREM